MDVIEHLQPSLWHKYGCFSPAQSETIRTRSTVQVGPPTAALVVTLNISSGWFVATEAGCSLLQAGLLPALFTQIETDKGDLGPVSGNKFNRL